jgi:hypothetical protein
MYPPIPYDREMPLTLAIRLYWHTWHDLERGAAIVRLRKAGFTHRELATIAGCSEGNIRNMEIVGLLPWSWKEALMNGHSTREVLKAWRAQQRRCSGRN